MAPMHEHVIDAYNRKGAGEAAKEFFLPTSIARASTNALGRGNDTTGLFGAINKFTGNTDINKKIADDLQATYQDDYDAKLAEANALKAENGLLAQSHIDDLINRRNAGETNIKDNLNIPNKNIEMPTLQTVDNPRVDNPTWVDKNYNKLMSGRGGNNKVSKGYNNFTDNLNSLGDKYFSHGGQIKGKGTGTSDSIKAKIKPGSFIVPAKNKEAAKELKKEVLGVVQEGDAKLDHDNGVEVRLSNGEELFTPEQVELVTAAGYDLNKLAPESKQKLSNHLKCGGSVKTFKFKDGGMVKGYAKGNVVTGGDDDFVKKEKAKIEVQRKADEQRLGKVRAKQLADERSRKLNADIYKMLEFQNKAKKTAAEERKAAETELNALKKSYEAYDKESAAVMNLPQTATDRYVRNSKPKQEDITKEKERLLSVIEEKQKAFDEANKKLEFANNERNFINEDFFKGYGLNKESTSSPANTGGIDYLGGRNRPVEQYDNTKGPVAPEVVDAVVEKPVKPVSNIPAKVNEIVAPDVTFNPNAYINNDPEVVVPNGNNYTPPNPNTAPLANRTVTGEYGLPEIRTGDYKPPNAPAPNAEQQKKGFDWNGLLSGVASYGLPIAQTAIGLRGLKKAGPRPVDNLDPDFLNSIQQSRDIASKANIAAQYGLSSDQIAQARMDNLNATNSARATARNLAGGNAAVAFNLERAALNDMYGRNLNTKVLDNNTRLQKQQIAADRQNMVNDLTWQKQGYNRNLFLDNLNKWQQNQSANSNLLGAGINNFIGANRYEQEKQASDKRNDASNNWLSFYGI
jgi:hypothetical protein